MRWSARRERFRSLLESGSCYCPASVFDPISARIAQNIGYEAAMLAGSVASMTALGAPDLILLTLTEFAEQAYRISRAATLPLIVDADHGYGNALNVMRTVEELEAAGVAALTIEDTLVPAAFGSTGKSALIPIEEGIGKMKAALSARSDAGLVVIGRTSAPAIAASTSRSNEPRLTRLPAWMRSSWSDCENARTLKPFPPP
jgi:carboxyvinyl-carboxyphosphonate phosphorylmutase